MKFTEDDMDWQHAHGVACVELAKANQELARLRRYLRAIQKHHEGPCDDGPRLDYLLVSALGEPMPSHLEWYGEYAGELVKTIEAGK